ncbi:hypothetical protein [Profundibacter sp.]
MGYQVSGSGFSWRVTDAAGVQHGQYYRNNADAFEFAKRLEQADKVHTRSCLCCTVDFKSEGAHNRMCSKCRQLSGGMM